MQFSYKGSIGANWMDLSVKNTFKSLTVYFGTCVWYGFFM